MYHEVEIDSVAILINDPSQVGEARRAATNCAQAEGLDEEDAGKLALIVAEAATNLIKHAGGGEILIQKIHESTGEAGIELLALDRGPGMRDLTVSMRDGHSTSGSLGMGLGVIRRIASFFEIYSLRDSGTAILCRMLRPLSGPKPERNFIVGGVCIAKPGEEQSGDQWASRTYGDDLQILVSDGSGHGLLAHDASVAAVASFLERGQATPSVIMERAHQALRSTRGAATAVSEINTARQELRFAGVGNITGTILNGPLRRNAVSHHGTLGHQVQKFQEFSYPWKDDAVLVMCSDGVSTRWTLDQYPGLIQRHPSLIAGVLYRDFGRNSDDTCVVVARGNS